MELVQPLSETPTPEVSPTVVVPETAADWPKELVESNVMQALVAGAPPAVSGNIKDFSKRPEGKVLTQHRDLLSQAGMAFYRSLDGDLGVIFNQRFVNPEQVRQADQAGQLTQIAPPFDSVEREISKSGLKHPAIQPGSSPSGFAQSPAPVAGQMPAPSAPVAPPPASAQRKSLTAKISNAQPGSPTSGTVPGAGTILRSILKPVV